MADERAHVVILGGGFGGLAAARALKRAPVRMTLVDARNHHLFQPLLYQVATAGLNPSDIAAPIRGILRKQKNVEVVLGRAVGVDVGRGVVELRDDTLSFDYLIVATGATHSYFGHDEWEEHAPGLKSVEDALEIRRRVLFAFEAAERERDDPDQRRACLTFVVVGGGPTGVELARALGELSNHTLSRDFRRIDPREAKVILCEGSERILGVFDEDLSVKAVRQLEKLGVTVMTGARVEVIDPAGVTLLGGERIPSRTVLWAAGVAGSPLARSLDAPLDRAGRVLVEPSLLIPGSERVFVIGDLAALKNPDGEWIPGLAPAALQAGRHAAGQIRRLLRGEVPERFTYVDKGTLATIGRKSAVGDLGWIKLSGYLAWVAWLTIHIFFLIGFRNRLIVLFQWFWAYVTFQRGARLITGSVGELRQRVEALHPEPLPEPTQEAPPEGEASKEEPEASGAGQDSV